VSKKHEDGYTLSRIVPERW